MSATAPKEVWDEAMRKAGYASARELAEAVGVTEKSLERWMKGISHPRHKEDVDTLADLLYIDAEILFPGWQPTVLRGKDEEDIPPLRAAMLRAGYETIHSFAAAVGVFPTAIKNWMRGSVPREDDTVYRVAGLLNVAPTDLWPDWKPSTNPFKQKIFDAGYPTVTAFARKIGIAVVAVDNWIHDGAIPRSDATVYKAAELLHTDPHELWPDWEPRPKQKTPEYIASHFPRSDHGVTQARSTPDTIAPGMEDMRRNAQVYVGQRFVMIHPTKEGTVRKPGIVVECAPCWFRVQYDCGWCECFHYQCRIDQTEAKHFRKPAQNA